MSNITEAIATLIDRILEGPGYASQTERRAAFDGAGINGAASTLVAKIAFSSISITDADITSALTTGLTEDQLFEIAVCAAVGQSSRQHQAALTALVLADKE